MNSPVFESEGRYLPLLLVDLEGVPLLLQGCSPGTRGLQVDLHRPYLLVARFSVRLSHELDAHGGTLSGEKRRFAGFRATYGMLCHINQGL